MSPEELLSLVRIAADEEGEKRVEIMAADTEIQHVPSEKRVVAPPQAVGGREDDWFVLLDVPTREPSYVPPGIDAFPSRPMIKTYKHIIRVLILIYPVCQ